MEFAHGGSGERDEGGSCEGAQVDDDGWEEHEGVAWGWREGGEWEQGEERQYNLGAGCGLREEAGEGQGGGDGELGGERDLEEAQAGDEWELVITAGD